MPVFLRLFTFLRPYRTAIFIALLCLIGSVALELAPGFVWKWIVDVGIAKRTWSLLPVAIGILVAIQAVDVILSALRTRLFETAGQRFVFDLRNALFTKLMRLPLGYYADARTGDLMSRVGSDVDAVQEAVLRGVDSVVGDFLRLIGVSIIFCWLNLKLGLATLVPIVLVGVLLRLFNDRVKNMYKASRERLGVLTARLQDNLSGIRVIKGFARDREETENFRITNTDYLRANLDAINLRTIFYPVTRWVAGMGSTIMIGYGAVLILRGEFTLGGLIAYRTYGRYFYGPIDTLMQVNDLVQRAIAAGTRLFEVLDTPETVSDAPDARILPPVQGEIAFDHVSFGYEGVAKPVLNDVSFHVYPGQTVALVGESGAGKSTIFSLVARFYDPTAGQVCVDGTDLKTVTQYSLRRQVAMVQQETFLFTATVAENIRYARPDATDAEVEAAARAANAHSFITELPKGYESRIGERGVKLSGGQRQRLSVARAFLAGGGILLLDEATSAVEPESEQIIQEAIERLMRGRTTLIATHRLSTIRNADLILVIDKGELIEQGTHAALMRRDNGVYARMVRQQSGADRVLIGV